MSIRIKRRGCRRVRPLASECPRRYRLRGRWRRQIRILLVHLVVVVPANENNKMPRLAIDRKIPHATRPHEWEFNEFPKRELRRFFYRLPIIWTTLMNFDIALECFFVCSFYRRGNYFCNHVILRCDPFERNDFQFVGCSFCLLQNFMSAKTLNWRVKYL